jgi:hypothetical protein
VDEGFGLWGAEALGEEGGFVFEAFGEEEFCCGLYGVDGGERGGLSAHFFAGLIAGRREDCGVGSEFFVTVAGFLKWTRGDFTCEGYGSGAEIAVDDLVHDAGG